MGLPPPPSPLPVVASEVIAGTRDIPLKDLAAAARVYGEGGITPGPLTAANEGMLLAAGSPVPSNFKRLVEWCSCQVAHAGAGVGYAGIYILAKDGATRLYVAYDALETGAAIVGQTCAIARGFVLDEGEDLWYDCSDTPSYAGTKYVDIDKRSGAHSPARSFGSSSGGMP